MSETFECPYCGKQRPATERTREHVVPAALGGATEPQNPFIVTACVRCNTACGRYVDGPFIRSWLISNRRSENARTFVDLSSSPAIPLTCMGPLEDAPRSDSRVCDFWLGPAGDTIYHFHDAYEAEDPTTVGPPTHLPKGELDAGFVFLFVRASNPAWHLCIVQSVLSQFERATIYLGNGPAPSVPRFQPIPAALSPIRDDLKARSGTMHHVTLAMKVDFGDRFLAKLALGFGALCLGAGFIASPYAVHLRNFLWCRDGKAREQMPVAGTSFLGDLDDDLRSLLSVPFGHAFVLMPAGNRIVLFVSFYGENSAAICVSDDSAICSTFSDGRVYVVAPGYRTVVGPVALDEFLAARRGTQGASPALQALMARVEAQPPLPPFDLSREQHEAAMKHSVQSLAYRLWEQRGRPLGDDHSDWYSARRRLGVPDELDL